MRVLFVNHTGIKSGAEASLLDLVAGMPDDVQSLVACPEGELEESLRDHGVGVQRIPGIDASLRLHPTHTPLGLGQMLRSANAVRRASRRHRADIVHANSVRAGLAAGLASVRGGPPVVVHVRDCLPATKAANITRAVLARRAALVLANSGYTAASFLGNGRMSPPVEVVHSPIDLERFDPARSDGARARSVLGLGSEPVLAVVGQITPWKGQMTAIEALALVTERRPDVRLLIVGSVKFEGRSTRYDNRAYFRSLQQKVTELGLEKSVNFLGERIDVPEVLSAVDVLLTPSWEEPFGRAVVEAMAMGRPVIATSVGGPAEVIEDGVSGRLVPPGDTAAWSRAVEELVSDPRRRQAIGEEARRKAMAFGRRPHVERVLAAYRRVLGPTG